MVWSRNPLPRLSLAVVFLLAFATLADRAQSAPVSLPAIDVLAQSPADTVTELQVICLFRSDSGIALKGALAEMDEKTHGLLTDLRRPNHFHGELGETILLTPPAGSLKAKRLLIIGLGDPQTFTADRMRLVGTILLREAERLGVSHPYFAPTIKDGGVDRFSTGDIAVPLVQGFLEAYSTEKHLETIGASSGNVPAQLTFLAGKQYQASTQSGIDKAVAAAAR